MSVTMRALLLVVAMCASACSTRDNLGNHLFGEARWSFALGSPGGENATAAIVDPIGNVIVAGTCGGTIDFGSGPRECSGSFVSQRASDSGSEQWTAQFADARVTQLVNVGTDVHVTGTRPGVDGVVEQFVAVLDRTGKLRSTRDLGVGGMVALPIGTLAADGTVYMTGAMSTDRSFTADTLDIFVGAYSVDGTPVWSTTFTGEGYQLGGGLSVAPDGDVVLLVEANAPFWVGNRRVDVDRPRQLIVRISDAGELVWAKAPSDVVHQIRMTPDDAVVVGGCPSSGAYDASGDEQWRVSCFDTIATIDAMTVSPSGEIVMGGHHPNPSDGELFLVAFDGDGQLIASARTLEYPHPNESRIDAIAVEPTGEVVFVISASHAFDFGNGMLPYAGNADVMAVKLDSTTGRDGQVVLARTIP
jgi:hypothetical protein